MNFRVTDKGLTDSPNSSTPSQIKNSNGFPYVLESSAQAVQLHYALVGESETKNTEKILPSFEQRNLMDFYGRHVSNQEWYSSTSLW